MAQQEKKTAGIFDIRNIIGALLTIYGVILTLMGLFADPETEKTGGSNANLVAGIVLLVMGLGFIAWAYLRPVKVPEHVEPVLDDPTRPAPKKKQRPCALRRAGAPAPATGARTPAGTRVRGMGEMTTVGDLPAYRAVPEGDGPWPGLVLVHEIFGLDDEMRRHADRLAATGLPRARPRPARRVAAGVVCLARTMTALRRGRGRAFDDLDATRDRAGRRPGVQRLGRGDRVLHGRRVRPRAGGPAGVGGGGGQLRDAAAGPRGARRRLPGRRELRRPGPLPARRRLDARDGADRARGRARRRGVPRRRPRLPQRDRERALVRRADVARRHARRPGAGVRRSDAWGRIEEFLGRHLTR